MGGAETSLRELLASIRAAAPDWELILLLGEDGPIAGRARALGVRVVVAPFPASLAQLGDTRRRSLATWWSLLKAAGATVFYARRLAETIRSIEPDIVHTNGFKMHLLGAWTCPRRIPLVWHIHDYVSTRPLMSRLLRRSAKRCVAAIVNSNSVAADLKTLSPGVKITTIYNAVDLGRFAPTGSALDLDAIAGLSAAPAGTVRVGLVGTFARWKGHKVFLRALSKLPAEAPIRGYVIGGPIYQTGGSQWSVEELRQEANRMGLSGKVGFTGFLDDTAAATRSLDIIVHASTQAEPFGMVIIEGMACGRAVIASQGGGAGEIFEDGKDAVGYPPGDADVLAAQILRLASDRSLRTTLGVAGRTKVERLFNGGRLSQQLMALYGNVINRKDFDPIVALKAETSAPSD
jgi:glycosyltransferase involved in cell wall biosynthesis